MKHHLKGPGKGSVKGIFGSKTGIALTAAALGAAVMATVGLGDVWSSSVSQDTTNVRLRVANMSTYNFDSGWHYHPGLVIVRVTKGTLTETLNDCTSKTHVAGDTFIETPYTPARVTAVGESAVTVTYVVGYGSPLAVPVSPAPCP